MNTVRFRPSGFDSGRRNGPSLRAGRAPERESLNPSQTRTDLVLDWFQRHERDLLLSLVAIAVVLRALLVAKAPAVGYVWDFYRDGVRLLATEGRLPVAADCWQCYHPPLFYVAGWPLYVLGQWIGAPGDDLANRLLAGLSLFSAATVTWYGYRLLRLVGCRGAALVGGTAILLASPILFISAYGAEADILLTAILTAFIFYLTDAFADPSRFSTPIVLRLAARGESPAAFARRCIPPGGVAPRSNTGRILARRAWPAGRIAGLGATRDFHHGLLGALAGLAAATNTSGLLALATAGVVMGIRMVIPRDRARVIRHGLTILVVALVIGGWKYIDNIRRYGTPLHANGSASEGLTLGARENRGGYEFTTFRLGDLRALFGPRPVQGELTSFPVYRSVWTTLHAQAWSDMSFFSVPSRHGDPNDPYPRRVTPIGVTMTTIVLGMVPEVLAVLGFFVTLRDRRYWPMAIFAVLTVSAYVAWFLPQELWALKTKYILCLLPVMVAYAMAAVAWIGRRSAAAGWGLAGLLAALVASAHVYQYRVRGWTAIGRSGDYRSLRTRRERAVRQRTRRLLRIAAGGCQRVRPGSVGTDPDQQFFECLQRHAVPTRADRWDERPAFLGKAGG